MNQLPSRDDSVTTRPVCAGCRSELPPTRGRQRYCNAACRQRAYRNRRPRPADLITGPARDRRANTIYQCPHCDTRTVGQQRCEDCNVFCARVGTGGACPCCEEPITVDELLSALTS